MKPTSDRILVEPLPRKQTGLIVLPDSAEDEHNSGAKLYRVIATGPGLISRKGVLLPMEVRAGDRVIAHSYTEGPVHLGDGSRRRIIRQSQVLLVFPHENP